MKQHLKIRFQNYAISALIKPKQDKYNASFLRTNHMILSFFNAWFLVFFEQLKNTHHQILPFTIVKSHSKNLSDNIFYRMDIKLCARGIVSLQPKAFLPIFRWLSFRIKLKILKRPFEYRTKIKRALVKV